MAQVPETYHVPAEIKQPVAVPPVVATRVPVPLNMPVLVEVGAVVVVVGVPALGL